MRHQYFSLLAITSLFLMHCQAKPQPIQIHSIKDADTVIGHRHDTSIIVNGIECYIQFPESKNAVGDLLLLPGWDFSNRKWCDSSSVCKTALLKGYRVVAPQMGRSVYASSYFPETRKDLSRFPTLPQLDSALELLKKELGFFKRKNLILGLSTGGRGVALICERKPDWFHAAAALSGDYNQVSMPKDNLMNLVYGPYAGHTVRWKQTDNPQTDANKLNTPIYLGHGQRDRIVPHTQTIDFAHTLKAEKNRMSEVVLHINPAAGHDFNYWRSELPAVWKFFEKHTN
jgi:pimeloyl-ACP methyl ester carboxylesterase